MFELQSLRLELPTLRNSITKSKASWTALSLRKALRTSGSKRTRFVPAGWHRAQVCVPQTRLKSSEVDHSQKAWRGERCCGSGIANLQAHNGVCEWACPALMQHAEAQICALRQSAGSLSMGTRPRAAVIVRIHRFGDGFASPRPAILRRRWCTPRGRHPHECATLYHRL